MRAPTLWILLVAAILLVTAPTTAQDEVVAPEDRDMIEAGDEELPTEIPGEAEPAPAAGGRTQAEEEHTVQPGDTLWDLCAGYLNNPWYWPRVWSYNPEITNPHWIYPGQVVRFYPGGELPSEILVSDTMELPEMVEEPLEEEVPENLVSWTAGKGLRGVKRAKTIRIRRDAFVTSEEVDAIGVVKASREEKKYLSEYDSIYIEFNNPGEAQVGKQYMIARKIKEVHHPVTEELEGYYTRVLGTARISRIDEKTATAVIDTSLMAIKRGDMILPMMPKLQKHVAPRPNAVELKGYILDSRMELTRFGEHNVVFIDQGTEDGVQEGNVFDVVRREDGMTGLGEKRPPDWWNEDLPMEIFGRIMIVDARPTASTGLVMASLRELHRGDRVLMSVK